MAWLVYLSNLKDPDSPRAEIWHEEPSTGDGKSKGLGVLRKFKIDVLDEQFRIDLLKRIYPFEDSN